MTHQTNRARPLGLGLELNYTVHEQIGCTWRSPDEEYYMLNTDGLVQQSSNGYGGTIRDSQGNVLMGFAGGSSNTSVIFQELFAIAVGLKQAQSLSIEKLEINSDSLGKRYVKLRLSTKALKTIEKNGLDAVAKKAGMDLRPRDLTLKDKGKEKVQEVEKEKEDTSEDDDDDDDDDDDGVESEEDVSSMDDD
ncbi:hypothetical protein IFM89_016326 [Coptis chinensis]|uniref:RNase H type-1 domain-containing protein n=1 Tax=Coptis chinensis TaxID=261450 RepID=A0A835HBA8_9MAGN|nr:hypothetical protein IFM89_016326 [Coptis chinensis]